MITVAKLNEMGCNTKEGLARCMNNEKFYIKMVMMGLKDKNFGALDKAVAEKNIKAMEDVSHALKGVMGNLAITPLYKLFEQMNTMLKPDNYKPNADYTSVYKLIKDTREKFLSLL